jgi:hypothetical protein
MFVSSLGSPHVPYARFQTALRAGDLLFIRRHADGLTLSLADEAEVCRLIASQDPARLEAASVRWIKRFALQAREERRSDYGLIVSSFDALTLEPALATGQLRALCAARGLDG